MRRSGHAPVKTGVPCFAPAQMEGVMTGPTVRSNMDLVLTAMTLANGMILVDQTAVPLAVPSIMKQL
jgi:hypothetical protein